MRAARSVVLRVHGMSFEQGKAHDMKRVCITVKWKLFNHQFVYSGVGDDRHCIFCQEPEGFEDATNFEKGQR